MCRLRAADCVMDDKESLEMVSRSENLANRNRKFHQEACAVMTVSQGAAIDTLPILQDIEALYLDCISTRYDAHYDCHHQPLFRDDVIRELIDALISAQVDVVLGPVGSRTASAIIAAAEGILKKHPKPQRERSRKSARRDIARTALCHAVITAMDATLNAVIATRLSKAKISRISRARSHGAT